MTYVRLSAGNKWRGAADADNGSATYALKLKTLPSSKLMVHVTGNNGVLRKSTDFGKVWTNAAMLAGCDSCLDVCEAPDGVIYGLFTATGSSTAHVGKSVNAMVSWTDLYTHDAGKQAFNISCSPERAADNTIAFTCRDDIGGMGNEGTDTELVISTDGGASFTTKLMGYVVAADDSDAPLIQFLPGSIVVMLRGEAIGVFALDLTYTSVSILEGDPLDEHSYYLIWQALSAGSFSGPPTGTNVVITQLIAPAPWGSLGGGQTAMYGIAVSGPGATLDDNGGADSLLGIKVTNTDVGTFALLASDVDSFTSGPGVPGGVSVALTGAPANTVYLAMLNVTDVSDDSTITDMTTGFFYRVFYSVDPDAFLDYLTADPGGYDNVTLQLALVSVEVS